MGCKVSVEGNIYSFGIILLEMITGKRPTDEMFKEGINLQSFVDTVGERLISAGHRTC